MKWAVELYHRAVVTFLDTLTPERLAAMADDDLRKLNGGLWHIWKSLPGPKFSDAQNAMTMARTSVIIEIARRRR